MKIAFLLRSFPSISETFVLNQITGLIERGHSVDIYSIYSGDLQTVHPDFKKYNLLERTYYPPQVPYHPVLRIIKAFYLTIANYKRLPQLLQSVNIFKYGRQAASLYLLYLTILFKEKKSYDVIHCHFGLCGLIGVDLVNLQLLEGKILTSFHGSDVNTYPRQHGDNIYDRLFKQGYLYSFNSDFTARQLARLQCPKEKMIKLSIGVNLVKYSFKARTISTKETVKILTVARLVECKGIEYSIRAIAKIISNFPNLCYQIVGDGPLSKSLKYLIEELELGQQVKLLGAKSQDEVQQLYASSQIFILSSVTAADGSQEGQGLVLQEAQAVGLPVISTSVGGIPEGVLDGKSAFLVPERDVEALAERLEYLLNRPEIWAEMGKAGRAHVEAKYDLKHLNDRLVAIYQGLLAN